MHQRDLGEHCDVVHGQLVNLPECMHPDKQIEKEHACAVVPCDKVRHRCSQQLDRMTRSCNWSVSEMQPVGKFASS